MDTSLNTPRTPRIRKSTQRMSPEITPRTRSAGKKTPASKKKEKAATPKAKSVHETAAEETSVDPESWKLNDLQKLCTVWNDHPEASVDELAALIKIKNPKSLHLLVDKLISIKRNRCVARNKDLSTVDKWNQVLHRFLFERNDLSYNLVEVFRQLSETELGREEESRAADSFDSNKFCSYSKLYRYLSVALVDQEKQQLKRKPRLNKIECLVFREAIKSVIREAEQLSVAEQKSYVFGQYKNYLEIGSGNTYRKRKGFQELDASIRNDKLISLNPLAVPVHLINPKRRKTLSDLLS